MEMKNKPEFRVHRAPERPKAGPFTYFLMFVGAFGVGFVGALFVALRMGQMTRNIAGTSENMTALYVKLGTIGAIGGVVAMIGLAGMLWGGEE